MNKSDKHWTSTHRLYSRRPLSSSDSHCASCTAARASVHLDLTWHTFLWRARLQQAARRRRGGRPGGGVTNTGQWGEDRPPAPGVNKPPHWPDTLSVRRSAVRLWRLTCPRRAVRELHTCCVHVVSDFTDLDFLRNKYLWKTIPRIKQYEDVAWKAWIITIRSHNYDKKSYNYKIKSLNCEMQGYNNEVKSWNYQIKL